MALLVYRSSRWGALSSPAVAMFVGVAESGYGAFRSGEDPDRSYGVAWAPESSSPSPYRFNMCRSWLTYLSMGDVAVRGLGVVPRAGAEGTLCGAGAFFCRGDDDLLAHSLLVPFALRLHC